MPYSQSDRSNPFDYISPSSDSSESSTLYSRFVSRVLETSPLRPRTSRDDQSSYTISATTSTDVDDITGMTASAYVDAINRAYVHGDTGNTGESYVDVINRVYAHGGTGNTREWLIDESADADCISTLKGEEMRNDANIIKKNLVSRYGDDITFVDGEDICVGRFAIYPGNDAIARNFLFLYSTIEGMDGSSKQFAFINVRGQADVVNADSVSVFFIPNSTMLDRYFARISENIANGTVSSNIDAFLRRLSESYPDRVAALNLKKCSCCGSTTARPTSVGDDKYVCWDCYEKYYFNCDKCNKVTERSLRHETKDGRWLCAECNMRHFVLPYHHLYPKVQFYGNNKGNNVPYMGFELEVDRGGESSKKVAQIMPLMNREDKGEIFAYCSHDGSIDNGFEIITQPATMEYHNSIKDVYNRTIQKLKSMGYVSHETSTCGLHVHINRDFFPIDLEPKALRNLVIMFNKFWNELCVYARRPEWRSARYARHLPVESCEIDEYLHCANKSGRHNWHYFALNIANQDTIEFRMFRGTLNVDTILATLQLVNNMAVFASKMSAEDVARMKFDELLTTKTQRRYWNRRKTIMDFEE